MKRRDLGLILVEAGLLCSCVQDPTPPQESTVQVMAVPLARLQSSPVSEDYEAVGTVRSGTTSTLSSKLMGTVLRIPVAEGSRVARGDILVEIDARETETRVAQARANLARAEHSAEEVDRMIGAAQAASNAALANAQLAVSSFQRYQELLRRDSVSRQEFEEVEARHKGAMAEVTRAAELLESHRSRQRGMQAQIEQARSALEEAGILLSHARIEAPFEGLVVTKHVDPGTLALPGAPLVTIEDPAHYRLETMVKESSISNLKLSQKVTVEMEAVGVRLEGMISEIAPTADSASRSFLVRIDLPRDPLLRSGMYGKALFFQGERDTLTVPETAIVRRGQLTGIYLVEDGTAHFHLVQTGKVFQDGVEVLSGLEDGQTYVVAPDPALREGMTIRDDSTGRRSSTDE